MKDFVTIEGSPQSEFEEPYGEELLKHAIFEEPLSKVRRRPTLTVPATASLHDVISAMNDAHVGCALVVRLNKLVGIFTERDVLRKVALAGADLRKTSVETFMTPDPDTLPQSASIAFALRTMSVEGYRHIPLVDSDGTPVGVVAVRDIVGWLARLFPETVLNLPPEPGYPKTVDGG